MTQSFAFLIPRCSNSIEDLGDSHWRLLFIYIDARSGYHNIRVHVYDRDKLVIFTPDGKDKCFIVMLFGPKNSPLFYNTMIKILRDDLVVLFNEKNLILSNTSVANIFCDSKTIIDDTLIFSNHITTLFHCSFCVAKVFTKCRLSFKLSKCHFFLYRIKYLGHNLIADGNCPPQSKFQFIKEYYLPPPGIYLLSFIGVCYFYSNCVP